MLLIIRLNCPSLIVNGSGEGPKHAGQNWPTVRQYSMQAAGTRQQKQKQRCVSDFSTYRSEPSLQDQQRGFLYMHGSITSQKITPHVQQCN